MRHLPVVLVTPVVLAGLAAPAAAQTTVSSNTSTSFATSTAASGAPSDIVIASGATVSPAAGTAVTIDSNNAVTNNGTITFTDVSNATGIGAATGLTGAITNTGTITVTETATATDENSDGHVDGPFATGVNRFGIHVAGGGVFTGAVTNSGTITVVGNTSAGMAVDGTLAGSLTSSGTISVSGANSYGIRTGAVTGDVTTTGTLTATGQGAIGVSLGGDIGGAVSIGGAITATGFRGGNAVYTTPIADDLYLGGPAVAIAGNVAGGVTLASGGTVTSYGSAPALLIGAATPLTLSPVAGSTYGLILAGTVTGSGVNAGIDGNAVVLGGLGGAVTIAGGVSLTGAVTAGGNAANATALTLGAGAVVPTLAVTGTLTATGGAGAFTGTAVLVNAGASLPSITNTGTISAAITNGSGTATAIRDLSGTLASITNTGVINASGATAGSGSNLALDLSADTGGVTVSQTGATARIDGDILLTGGADTLAVAAGAVTGNVAFGAGADTLALSGASIFTGNVDFGSAGAKTLTIADTASFAGALTNAGALAVSVTGGTLKLTAPATIGSLSVGAAGKLGIYLDATTVTTPSLTVTGGATLAAGATISPVLGSVIAAEGQHLAISAGQLQAGALTLDTSTLPYLYTASLAVNGNVVAIGIARKTATDLGLTGAQAVVYNPAYATLANDTDLANVFLAQTTAAGVQAALAQLLPDQSDATFEMATLGSRAVERITADPEGLIHQQDGWGYWAAPLGWHSTARPGATSGYDVSGWGVAGGAELETKAGAFGASLAYLDSRDAVPDTSSRLTSNQYQVAGTWRAVFDVLQLNATAGYARIGFGSTRQFIGAYGTTTVDRTATAGWHGDLFFAGVKAAYEMGGKSLYFRPNIAIDYDRLAENAHAESDAGGAGFALSVAARTSSEAAATASLAAGIDLYGNPRDFFGRPEGEHVFRIEAEGGRRQVFGGSLGDTTAQFAGGTAFTLDGEERDSGWIGRVRLIGGNDFFRLGTEVGAEQRAGHVATTIRANLRIAMF